MAAMVYSHPTGLLACLLLVLYTLFSYPRRLWRWLLPGILLLAITFPQLQARFGMAVSRVNDTHETLGRPGIILDFFHYYAGPLLAQQIGWAAAPIAACPP